MSLSPRDLAREAADTGFPDETLARVFRLMGLLDALGSHPYLKPRMALKGGTAINLFLLPVPRLSVDIDLNYIGAIDRSTMLAERPRVEEAIRAACSREALVIRRMPTEHAGGKWRLVFTTPAGDPDRLELDVNFVLRTPLWPPIMAECHPVGSFRAKRIRILDPHELAAGKLAALLSRGALRDLFDARELLSSGRTDPSLLRLGFVVYGGANRKDWRTVSADDVQCDPDEIQRHLVPVMRADIAPAPDEVPAWTKKLVDDCRSLLSAVLPLTPRETEFLRSLIDGGEILPELLTDDAAMQKIIREHPGLRWKALNARERPGSDR